MVESLAHTAHTTKSTLLCSELHTLHTLKNNIFALSTTTHTLHTLKNQHFLFADCLFSTGCTLHTLSPYTSLITELHTPLLSFSIRKENRKEACAVCEYTQDVKKERLTKK